jgi:hypothetical protein
VQPRGLTTEKPCEVCATTIRVIAARRGRRRCCSRACTALLQAREHAGVQYASLEEAAQASRARKCVKGRLAYAALPEVVAFRSRPKETPEMKRQRDRLRLRRYYAQTKAKQMLRAAKWRADAARVPFDLVEADIHIPATCPVLGIPITSGNRRAHDGSPALDRVIPSLGYVKGNVRVISNRANTLKRDGTLDEFRGLVAYLGAYDVRDRTGQVGESGNSAKEHDAA